MLGSFGDSLKQEFKGYNASKLTQDLMAGLTVAAVALPLALAFGVSSGADAAAGLITAIIAGLVMSGLSGGYYQISGPTGAMAAILMSLVATYGLNGVYIATLIAGILLLLSGILRLGKLTAFIPAPVITGFTSGIAVIIALGQIDNFFGTHSQGTSAISKLFSYAHLGFSPNLTAVLLGAFVVLFMVFFPKKWSAVIPASLLSIILATAASLFLQLDVAVVGEIPKTLIPESRLTLSALNIKTLGELVTPAFSIAILGMIESLLCGASAGRMTGVRLNSNQELIAQGVGNILLPFFGGIPATAAIARTSVAVKSGAQTRLVGIFHAVGLLISMFLLAPIMSQIPLAALAGVLMVTAWRMNEWESIHYIFSHKFKGAMLEFVATMAATIVFDLTIAILVGVVIGLVFLVTRLSFIEINYEDVDMSRMNVTDPVLCERYSNAKVVYITGPMIFANTQAISDIAEKVKGADTVLFSMRGVSNIDISCAQVLRELIEGLRSQGVDVALCGLPTHTMKMMQRTDLKEIIGEENFYWSVERVLLTNRAKGKFAA
ncbi:SulP family inorganic anion transporter [Anaerotignum propionicum]|uniref:C4-dicarboxylic acid transporter DauA n=2 Tax=root TaxID=1 RepID=A0A0X8V9G7_ANAPI|nr:SulP family inorganic anion transporter [Anaerotignum propionicum]AMJ39875.1 C4-dicarboxylic acid transporter DauA [Anaerotignum propionicum DSM 1682]MEA5056356.1 SulP family inorganic anion transporter [Anaerotignum propionicum]SHE27655.1 sulfate permease, SulP family [[Clostridium] propionicum DSM 1682] [Anaerotignum propionicum DSM 1682]